MPLLQTHTRLSVLGCCCWNVAGKLIARSTVAYWEGLRLVCTSVGRPKCTFRKSVLNYRNCVRTEATQILWSRAVIQFIRNHPATPVTLRPTLLLHLFVHVGDECPASVRDREVVLRAARWWWSVGTVEWTFPFDNRFAGFLSGAKSLRWVSNTRRCPSTNG